MDIQTISTIAQSPAVWAICCIILAGFIIKKIFEKNEAHENRFVEFTKETREESKERENKLMEHLARSDEAQERTAIAIEGINNSLHKLEGRVDNIEKNSTRKDD